MKYGLISYDYTTNLGNEIQSIAARRFLPQIDYYIEHEKLDQFTGDNVKMIMNGWFVDCPTAWPPSDSINPLLVSMHFTTTTKNKKRVRRTLFYSILCSAGLQAGRHRTSYGDGASQSYRWHCGEHLQI